MLNRVQDVAGHLGRELDAELAERQNRIDEQHDRQLGIGAHAFGEDVLARGEGTVAVDAKRSQLDGGGRWRRLAREACGGPTVLGLARPDDETPVGMPASRTLWIVSIAHAELSRRKPPNIAPKPCARKSSLRQRRRPRAARDHELPFDLAVGNEPRRGFIESTRGRPPGAHRAKDTTPSMPAFRPPAEAGSTAGLGPSGPFPRTEMRDPLERRWLHYAFLSRDGRLGMVANASWLGPDDADDETRYTTILLLHERGKPWVASQFNADISAPPWSAFRQPYALNEPRELKISASTAVPAVALMLRRTGQPCTSQCAPFAGNHHLRWQSEAGVRAQGDWCLDGRWHRGVDAVGYHERVRGRWGWPELGEWVFGFANDMGGSADDPPEYAAVFTFIRPVTPADATTASVMLWQRGHLRRHFPRRNVSFAVRGQLERGAVQMVPALSRLFGVPPMAPIPKRLVISARMGADWIVLDFEAEAAARVIIPSENSLRPFSVHEVVGPCVLRGEVSGRSFAIETRGIVEFAGGAGGP
ncbi:MAG: hypothetical protein ABI460_03755 [Caldimonas sp.]